MPTTIAKDTQEPTMPNTSLRQMQELSIKRSASSRVVAVATAISLIVTPVAITPAQADINNDMQKMFNDLGVSGSYTAPGAFRSQSMNIITGGEMQIRAPVRTYQLWNASMPSLKAGCGGVDAYLGSFSFINGAQFKQMVQQVANNTVGLIINSALKSINPVIASSLEKLQDDIMKMGNFNRNTCQMAEGLVEGLSGMTGMNTYSSCIKMGMEFRGWSQQEAQEKCKVNAPSEAKASVSAGGDRAVTSVTKDTNIIWESLKSSSLSKEEKEMYMNISGTIIMYADPTDPSAKRRGPQELVPSVENLNAMMNGDGPIDLGDPAMVGKIKIMNWMSCEDADCISISRSPKVITPFTTHVVNMLTGIRDKMLSDTKPTAQEIGFVNTTRIPVYRMLSLGYASPDTSLTDALIQQYGRAIAYDYAWTFLDRGLKDARLYLGQVGLTDTPLQEQCTRLRDSIDKMLTRIDMERNTAQLDAVRVNASIDRMQAIEREMYAALPTKLKSMLKFSAYMTAFRQGRIQ
jgi:conjugative transfer pilus assembly protein TraH